MTCTQRLRAFALCGLLLPVLAGCQPKSRIVASVNNVNITEEEFLSRLQTVDGQIFRQFPELDAGSVTMMAMIRQELTHQLAEKDKKTSVSDEQVNSYIKWASRNVTLIIQQLDMNKISHEDIERQFRYLSEQFAIGTDGVKPTDEELHKVYDAKKDTDLKGQNIYTLRSIEFPSEDAANQILLELKKNPNFQRAGEMMGAPLSTAANFNTHQFLEEKRYPNLSAILDTLKPNELTPAPVRVEVEDPQNPAAPKNPIWIVAQLIHKEPGYIPTFDEVKVLLQRQIMGQKQPDWEQHFATLQSEFTNKAQIHIYLNNKKYDRLIDVYIRPKSAFNPAEMQSHPPIGENPSAPPTTGEKTNTPPTTGEKPTAPPNK